MVTKSTKAAVGVILFLFIVWVYYLIPRGGKYEDSAVISLKTALGVYKDRNGSHPGDFRQLTEVLEEVIRQKCTIAETDTNQYHVTIYDKLYRYEIDLVYKLGPKNILEKFHVLQVRRIATNG